MEVQSAKTLLKVIGFVFAVCCLLLAYAAAVRLYERLTIAWLSSSHQQMGSLALDTGGNVLLLSMCILGVVTVLAINRKGLDGIISNWPYLVPCILIAAFWATLAAALGARRISWIIPAATLCSFIGFGAGWSALRQHGLPINARVSDMVIARERQKEDQRSS
jgi:hypothetical protein